MLTTGIVSVGLRLTKLEEHEGTRSTNQTQLEHNSTQGNTQYMQNGGIHNLRKVPRNTQYS